MSARGLRPTLLALALVPAMQGCIVVPQTREFYDADCRTMSKEIVLETAVVGRFQGCAGDACAAMLLAAGAITAASAVVSGSIAMVGNVAYWIERQGRCSR
jgi:hypothetical protein